MSQEAHAVGDAEPRRCRLERSALGPIAGDPQLGALARRERGVRREQHVDALAGDEVRRDQQTRGVGRASSRARSAWRVALGWSCSGSTALQIISIRSGGTPASRSRRATAGEIAATRRSRRR
jgi:hypothetical protein